ncbi:MAG: hypothetical protein QW474_01595 [Candidatus Aenigmatarchaeota archaeon]
MEKYVIKTWEDLNNIEFEKKFKADVYYKHSNNITKTRIMIEDNGDGAKNLFIFEKGSRIWGRRYSQLDFLSKIEKIVVYVENQKEKWERDIKRVIEYLTQSGLWSDIREDALKALEIGYEKINKVYNLYWEWDYNEKDRKLKELDPRFNTQILYYLRDLKIKKMNFGDNNEQKLQLIKEAMDNKRPIEVYGITQYDVSFRYDPETQRAWYEEEYKGKGNGHYYIALNNQYALFWEDD